MLSTAPSNSSILASLLAPTGAFSNPIQSMTLQKTPSQPSANIQLPSRIDDKKTTISSMITIPSVTKTSPSTSLLTELPPIVHRQRKNGKHLVLDLDETLVHTFEDMTSAGEFSELIEGDEEKMANFYSIDFPAGETLFGYIRPYADYFLDVAFNEFESVGVWSAGSKFYVETIVKLVFKGRPLRFVMSREDCNELRIKTEEIPCRYKPLANIYKAQPDHTAANTLIVDDRHDVCSLNCINNVVIPEFHITAANAPALFGDQSLLTLAKWFQTDQFRNTPDVRVLKSFSPFKI